MIAVLNAYSECYQQKPSTHLEFLFFLDEKADVVYNGQTLKTYLQNLESTIRDGLSQEKPIPMFKLNFEDKRNVKIEVFTDGELKGQQFFCFSAGKKQGALEVVKKYLEIFFRGEFEELTIEENYVRVKWSTDSFDGMKKDVNNESFVISSKEELLNKITQLFENISENESIALQYRSGSNPDPYGFYICSRDVSCKFKQDEISKLFQSIDKRLTITGEGEADLLCQSRSFSCVSTWNIRETCVGIRFDVRSGISDEIRRKVEESLLS